MPKCAVWSCRNSSNNIRIRDGVSFFHYPRDPFLASRWWSVLAPVVSDSFKPATAVICSDHFHNDHKHMCKTRHRLTRNAVPDLQLLGPVTNFNRSSTMLPQYDEFDGVVSSDDEMNMIVDIPEILRPPSESMVCRVCLTTEGRMKRVTEDNYEEIYKQVTGIKWNKEDKLPQHLCWECGHRLQSAAKVKRKALAAHTLLQEIRSDQNFLTLNDIKQINRNFNQLVSNLTEKHFPPNQYLSRKTINKKKSSSQSKTELEKQLKSDPDEKYSQKLGKANEAQSLVNLERLAEKAQLAKNDVKLDINPNMCSITVTYNDIKPPVDDLNLLKSCKIENPEPEDLSLTTYNYLKSNIDCSLDTYENPNLNGSNLATYKNIQSNTDTYNNLNPNNDDSYLSAYKNVDTSFERPIFTNSYKNIKPTGDAPILASYLKQDTKTLQNSTANSTYKNSETNDNSVPTYKDLVTDSNTPTYKNLENIDDPVPAYNNLESRRDMPVLNIAELPKLEAPKEIDSSFLRIKEEDNKYDSDESDILVIDADRDRNDTLETVIKSEYVGNDNDEGMVIDELIDIYNNDGDGDGRLQELNDRFEDEPKVKLVQGWGIQKRKTTHLRRGRKKQETVESMRLKAIKPCDVLTGNNIRSRAYEKLSRTLFTLTPVSEAEQIADISKRQDTFRFKRAPFKCYLCFRCFQTRRAYETHMLRHDASNGAFECTVCKSRQKSPRAVKSHMYGQHSVKISCNDCSFVTMNRSVARSHEKWHAGTIFKCPHCPSQFDHESKFKCHLRTRHVHAFACALCGFTFVSRKGLAVHRCKRHADADQIPLLGPHCDACELRFVSEEAYTRHLKMSSRHRPDNLPSNIGLRVASNLFSK